jgi:sugar/nucleoside kinase (ribokinase family)
MSILVVGSVALDTISTPMGRVKDALGGSATYFSLSARFFSPVSLVAVVGRDFPKSYLDIFKDKGINLEGLRVCEGKTFRWEGQYGWDFSDPQTIATHLNVFASFNPVLPPAYQNSEYVFLANIDPELQIKVLNQVFHPKLVACDTMNYWIENKPTHLLKLLKMVDIFLLNESEIRKLTSETAILKAAKKILALGPKIVVVKKGEHGILLFSGNNIFAAPAFLLDKIFDPTGAGDTFAGGFMGYLAKCKKINQLNLRKAAIYGSVMATFAVEDFSLRRLQNITIGDINKRIKEFKKFTAF